jgi:hypothetical protein
MPVSERFTTWGRMVADRYREQRSGDDMQDDAQREETGRKLDDAAREMSDQLNRAFTALGETLRDTEAKDRLKDAVKALGDAVSMTVTETTEEIRKRMRSTEPPSSPGDADTKPPSSTGDADPTPPAPPV